MSELATVEVVESAVPMDTLTQEVYGRALDALPKGADPIAPEEDNEQYTKADEEVAYTGTDPKEYLDQLREAIGSESVCTMMQARAAYRYVDASVKSSPHNKREAAIKTIMAVYQEEDQTRIYSATRIDDLIGCYAAWYLFCEPEPYGYSIDPPKGRGKSKHKLAFPIGTMKELKRLCVRIENVRREEWIIDFRHEAKAKQLFAEIANGEVKGIDGARNGVDSVMGIVRAPKEEAKSVETGSADVPATGSTEVVTAAAPLGNMIQTEVAPTAPSAPGACNAGEPSLEEMGKVATAKDYGEYLAAAAACHDEPDDVVLAFLKAFDGSKDLSAPMQRAVKAAILLAERTTDAKPDVAA